MLIITFRELGTLEVLDQSPSLCLIFSLSKTVLTNIRGCRSECGLEDTCLGNIRTYKKTLEQIMVGHLGAVREGCDVFSEIRSFWLSEGKGKDWA